MMASYTEKDDQLFVTCDEISFVSDSSSVCSEGCVTSGLVNSALGYEFWTKEPCSVDERRDRFLTWMGLGSDWDSSNEDEENNSYGEGNWEAEPIPDSERQLFSRCSLESFRSYDDTYLLEGGSSEEDLSKMELHDVGTYLLKDSSSEEDLTYGRSETELHDVGASKMISLEEFWKTLGSSSFVQQILRKDFKGFNIPELKKGSNWFQRFSSISHIVDRTKGFLRKPEIDQTTDHSQRVRVSARKKKSKELSSLHTAQEFPAHEGSILTMKFSPDGFHLASAGVDGVVRVWEVVEDEVLNTFNSQDIDPLCLYFTINDFSKLAPFCIAKERDDRMKSLKKSTDSSCVILPEKAFQLSEKPLHEFHGHEGEVLALSWCKNGYLLSSSVDKTARLWRVGDDHCQGVYLHSNYVTCVEFNPVDENRFISGSIDGKIRIWEVEGGRVIDWIDIGEIVTAVCYCPDGKGGVVGSMDGNCRFYEIVDNRLHLGASICLKGKKKLPGNRIIGFQYCPTDASKLMVTSADSRVQILSGTNIIYKSKGGHQSSPCQMPASFTSDGTHIISATDNSNVRVWNCTTNDQKSSRKKTLRSYESFFSQNASIAIPWCGLKNKLGALPGTILKNSHFDERFLQMFHASFPDCFTARLGFLLEAFYKVSATWPEDKLPKLDPITGKPSASKSEFKFLKNAWLSAFNNAPHLWGLVIVTAGWDGCIRTFLNYGLPIRF